jgi:pSer/pThr/pTyr-binding forkhead associated (FHA) protein
MPSELTLFFTDEYGQEQQVVVHTNPFTIGRQEGNELVINDAGLSRRHALITSFNEVAQITDCGSQNGTFLNGQPLHSATILKNGDVISMGQNCKIRVQVVSKAAGSPPVVAPPVSSAAPPAAQASIGSPPSSSSPAANEPSANSLNLSPMLIAGLATGVIVLIAGVLIVVLAVKKPKPPTDNGEVMFTATPVILPASPTTSESASPTTGQGTNQSTGQTGNEQLEKSLIQVIRNISNDQSYPFSPEVLAEIKTRARAYATPTLAATLRSLAARGNDTSAYINAQGLKPALLFYLALADTNGGQAGDPLPIARQAIQEVQFLRGHFGSNFADQTLLVVAAYKIPGGSKKSHPLLGPLRQLVRNPQTDRNVWFLRQKGALSNEAYEFVLRFLAYGAIAQNPRQFGLDASALVF